MDIWIHTVISAIIAAVLWPFFGPLSLLVFVGGVLSDADHVLWYLVKYKTFNLKKSYDYCKDISVNKRIEIYKKAVLIFHSFDALIGLLILSIIYNPLYIVLLGLVVHLFLDFIAPIIFWKGNYFACVFRKSAIVFLYQLIFKKKRF
ncbi:hypothetical protein HQ533_05645 [Candidatus Woesearchaeota archaeon]|nr:hypothetical protein [Candidatus Woesearchaeota archaeon]